MSGRSFDMTRKAAPAAKPASKPAAKKSTPRPEAPRKRRSLRERRERARSRVSGFIFILIALAVGVVIYGFWRPEVRVSEVHAASVPDEERASTLVEEALAGTYFGIFPRDSIFFYPEKELHAAVLDAFPSLEKVTVSRDSFTALSIEGMRRTPAFLWCGESSASFSVSSDACFEADAAGLIFAARDVASSTESMSELPRIYSAVEGGGSTYPVRGTVAGAIYMPNLLQFVQSVKKLGVPVLSSFIDGDEAELYVTPETRLIYVLGKEEEAARDAEAAFKDLNLLNGSIEYVDLRFPGKLYVKRYE